MATSPALIRSISAKDVDGGRSTVTVFDVFLGERKERIVLQRLIVMAHHSAADRTLLGAHYEKLNSQLSRQYPWDRTTGLLLLYPNCLLHVIESSREVLLSVVKDLTDLQQQQSDGVSVETSRLFLVHQPAGRLFQQWSYKVLDADQEVQVLDADQEVQVSEDQSTETLVCLVVSALQQLSEHLGEQLETSDKAGLGSVSPESSVSEELLHELLARDELLTPQQHLQMYNAPLSISMDFGGAVRSSCLSSV